VSEQMLLTVAEAGRVLSVSRATAYRLVTTGELPVVRIRGMLRVPVARLERWIADQEGGSGKGAG
jgi:excisionase family DNA binding protein